MKLKSNITFQSTLFLLAIFVIFIASFGDAHAQGRRGKDIIIITGNPLDSSYTSVLDSVDKARQDSIRKLPVDSTARLKYFKYIAPYNYGTKPNTTLSPIVLGGSSEIKYEVSFDSLNNVIIRETFNGEDIKAPLVMPIDAYLKLLSREKQRSIFNDIVNAKFQGNTQDDLSKLFEKITNITIPLPFKSETIFGPPTINLSINGIIDITASYQKISSEITSAVTADNTQNNINFKQDVQVTARGKVGDKLSIDADWNTTRTFDFENQLKLRYDGYADEVIQKIEAGNVSLDTRNSLVQSSQALFGIRGEFKLGPLTLTTVVSQKKSKQETKDFSGGATQQDFTINVYNYSDNHYFLDTAYRSNFTDYMADGFLEPGPNQDRQVSLDNFEVWVQTQNTTADRKNASLLIDLQPLTGPDYDTTLYRPEQIQGRRYFGIFRKLSPTEYTVNTQAGFISLKTNVNDNDYIGVSYKEIGTGRRFGTNSVEFTKDTLVLKMVKAGNINPATDDMAWSLKLKNIYRLPVSRVVEDGFEFRVSYVDPSSLTQSPSLPNGKQVLEVVGLDKFVGKGPEQRPDNYFDFLSGRTVNTETGDIIFPTLQPFLDPILSATGDTSLVFREIYTKLKSEASISPNNSKYIITGKARGESGVSSTVNLGFNVVEGSVIVKVGETPLTVNQDYVVDYTTGTVTIKNAAALASKDLKISYEQNELFSLASKTFIGARADYKISDKTTLGFTYVNLKQETLNDKVRIGEEPTNNSMFGVDFTTEIKSKLLTKFVNYLPGFNSKEESGFTFKGEFAMITGDPNTKKSNIPSDNNEAVAYVDDMEGSKKIISLGSNYTTWTVSSIPVNLKTPGLGSIPDTLVPLYQSMRGRMRWYNIPNDVSIKDIYPLRDVAAGQDRITPFYITYNPNDRGQYNYNTKYNNKYSGTTIDTMLQYKAETFNGIMKYLNSTTTDLVSENINFIEFSMRVSSGTSLAGTNAKLNIDLGIINEDAIPNGILNTEDKNNNGTLEVPPGTDEDIGLDMLIDADEIARYPGLGSDPSLDNNGNPPEINYDAINGTERNRYYDGGNKPDTEDLNKNGTLDKTDAYRTYSVSLDTVNNTRIVGRGSNGWAQYRIPLSEFSDRISNAGLNNVQYVRIWVTGLTDTLRVALVDLNLVGNQWVKPNREDTTYSISVVSIEENPQIYQSPVGGDILRQTIINQNSANTKSNESSLSIDVRNLSDNGLRKYARKDYGSAPLDLFNYKRMKLFVNGDPTFNYTNENIYDAAMVVRFGTDSNNYYEYRAPIRPDVRPGQPWNAQNEVTINFTDLAAIKLARDTSGISQAFPVPNGPPGSFYIIKGNPALNIIREIVLGVEKNRSSLNTSLNGSTWFNEIRLLKVNDDNGYAYNFSAGLKLSDLMLMNLNYSKVDPNFHAIDARVGSRNTGQNWDLSATFNAHKLINNAFVSLFGSEKWANFINMPITFRHSENLIKPKYFPGTDVEVTTAADQKYAQILNSPNGTEEEAQRQSENLIFESQTLGVQNSINISGMSFNFPVDNYFFKNILNRLQFNVNANLGDSRNETYSYRSEFQLSGGVAFATDFGLSDKLHLNLGKLLPFGEKYKEAKLYFFFPFIGLAPLYTTNFTAASDFNRTKNESQQRKLANPDAITRLFGANRSFGMDWKFIENWIVDLTGSYQFRAGSDLTGLETYQDSLRTQRPTGEIVDDIFFNNGFINFGKDLTYTQSVLIHPKFNFPVIDKFLTFNLDYNVTYGWTDPNTTTNLGYNVGFQNSVTSGATVKLSELFSIFKKDETAPGTNPTGEDKFRSKLIKGSSYLRRDSTSGGKTDPAELLKLFKTFLPDNITVSVTQSNQVFNTNISGRPGFANFWLYPTANEQYGPSRSYQLGLGRDPGLRTANVNNLTDAFNLNNDLQFSTTISPIFPEAVRMGVTFKTSWGNNTTRLFNTNEFGGDRGTASISNLRTKAISTFFVGDVEKFTIEGDSTSGRFFADAVKTNLAGIPFPNWTLTISGLEKFPLFSEFAQSVTLDNSFQSEYSEGTTSDITDYTTVTTQRVVQSFSPLIGLNFNFKQLVGGNFTANFKYNKAVTYIINPQSSLIQSTNTNDWSINANYTKAGFDIPLFGLSLKNDISFALTIARTLNDPIDYVYPRGVREKRPGAGSSQMTINPSIQYSLSSKVTMQLFYKYIKTQPTENTVAITPRTSNEGGLNIKITIQ